MKRDPSYQDTGIVVIKDICKDLTINPYGHRSYVLSITNYGEVYFEMAGVSATYPEGERYFLYTDDGDPSTGWVTNQWCHIAATYDGQHMRIYVNGTERAQRSAAGTPFASLGPLVIGNTTDNNFRLQFDGEIDEVYIWDSARTITEIQDDADNPPESTAAHLVGCWRFEGLSCDDIWQSDQGMTSDFNKDCVVDFRDLSVFTQDWLLAY